MTDLEYRRFVLDGLNQETSYAVSLRGNTPGPTPFVVATATIPKASARSWTGSGFQLRGAPLDQVLLQPGAPVKVSGVSRLSFVVLTTTDAPEMMSSIDVAPRGAAPPPKRGSPALPGESCRDFAPPGVDCAALEQVGAGKR